MRDTIWDGKPQRMAFNIGIHKGLIQVLKEINRYHPKMKLEDMRKEISSHQEFLNEKRELKRFLNDQLCITLLYNAPQVPL